MIFKVLNFLKKYAIWKNLIFLAVVLFFVNQNRIQNIKPFMADSIQNATYSYHLAYKNLFSLDGVSPSYLREPLMPFIHSVYIKLFTSVPDGLTQEELISNLNYVEQISRINIFYLGLLFFSIWYLVFQLTRSHILVIPLSLFSFGYFSMGISFTISQLSEVPAVILVNFFIGVLISIRRKPSIPKYLILGSILGFLAILKAVFYYLGFGFILIYYLINAIFDNRISICSVRYFLVFLICFFAVIFPWMLRNKFYFNDFSIAERGGTILLLRAVKNQMTDEEFKGGFYAWAPDPVKNYIFEPLTNYSRADLMDGGTLRRFSRNLPEDREFFKRGEIDSIQNFFMRTLLVIVPKLSDNADSLGVKLDVYLKDYSIGMILSDFPNHLEKSVLFFWRGIWFYEGRSLILNSLIFVVFLSFWISIVLGWIRLDKELIIISLLPILYLFFHIFLTHNLPRYSYPILSLLTIFPYYSFEKSNLYTKFQIK